MPGELKILSTRGQMGAESSQNRISIVNITQHGDTQGAYCVFRVE